MRTARATKSASRAEAFRRNRRFDRTIPRQYTLRWQSNRIRRRILAVACIETALLLRPTKTRPAIVRRQSVLPKPRLADADWVEHRFEKSRAGSTQLELPL